MVMVFTSYSVVSALPGGTGLSSFSMQQLTGLPLKFGSCVAERTPAWCIAFGVWAARRRLLAGAWDSASLSQKIQNLFASASHAAAYMAACTQRSA